MSHYVLGAKSSSTVRYYEQVILANISFKIDIKYFYYIFQCCVNGISLKKKKRNLCVNYDTRKCMRTEIRMLGYKVVECKY
jgi:predicted  nucleic acid-binding Zn ribbon protein